MAESVKEPLVSIVIPVFNAEEYLEDSLRSVLEQSYRNLEIICVNDGSTDQSLAILQKFEKKDHRIRILSQDNQGAGAARNLGMKAVKGNYILFFDADDLLKKRMVQTLVNVAKKHDPDIVLFGYDKFTDGKKFRVDYSAKTLKVPMNKVISPADISDRLFQADHGMPWNKFYKAGFLQETKVYFQTIKNTEDEFFSRITTVEAKRILFLQKILIDYRVGNKRSLQGNTNRNILDCTKALSAIYSELKVRGCYDTYSDTYKKLAGYIVMLKLLATDESEMFRILAEEISNNTLIQCEMDEDHLEDCYKGVFRALYARDFAKAEAEMKVLRQRGNT